MLIGYARVSTDDQHLDLQRDALTKAGCERVFEDNARGAKAERTGLTALLATLRRGDTVVIRRLDRLGRPLKDLIYLVERLDAAGVGLRSLQESIDTASIGGRLVFHLFGALAEFERNLIREAGYRIGEKPVSAALVESVLSRQLDDLEPTLTATATVSRISWSSSTRSRPKSRRCSATRWSR
ncbi:recombinase family protein [Paraburkholderia heleia]|uniref:recombinase family protein n=1 Tax=Paraburkholderia heleia TaxID=634127 RepID=UPI002AB6BFDC|nr:recombinase family protein [Paraburkholderia heleia]